MKNSYKIVLVATMRNEKEIYIIQIFHVTLLSDVKILFNCAMFNIAVPVIVICYHWFLSNICVRYKLTTILREY